MGRMKPHAKPPAHRQLPSFGGNRKRGSELHNMQRRNRQQRKALLEQAKELDA